MPIRLDKDQFYDSDDDLTLEERKKIKNSYSPQETRDQVWDKKGMFSKLKRGFKRFNKRDIRDDS